MNKTIIYIIITLLLIHSSFAHPIISAFLYDPEGSDSGYEWIELYNPTNDTISLQNYTILAGNGATQNDWTTKWRGENTTIAPFSFFLIGEEYIQADYNTELKLQNGPDAIQIKYGNNTLETIGWGNHEFEEYYQGTPIEDKASTAITRLYNKENNTFIFKQTQNNSNDFTHNASYTPKTSFYNSLLEQTNGSNENITFVLEIPNAQPVIHSIEPLFKDISIEKGFQIIPTQTPNLTFTIEIQDNNTIEDIQSCIFTLYNSKSKKEEIQEYTINKTSTHEKEFINTTFTLNQSLFAGTYYTDIQVKDRQNSISEINRFYFEVLPVMGIDVSKQVLFFEQLNQTTFSDTFEITNTGNTALDFFIQITGFTNEHKKYNFSESIVSYNTKNRTIKQEQIRIPLQLLPNNKEQLNITVELNNTILSGVYSGYVQLIGAQSE